MYVPKYQPPAQAPRLHLYRASVYLFGVLLALGLGAALSLELLPFAGVVFILLMLSELIGGVSAYGEAMKEGYVVKPAHERQRAAWVFRLTPESVEEIERLRLSEPETVIRLGYRKVKAGELEPVKPWQQNPS